MQNNLIKYIHVINKNVIYFVFNKYKINQYNMHLNLKHT